MSCSRSCAGSRAGEGEARGALIDDDVLGAFAVVGPVDGIAAALAGRCAGVIDRVLPGFPAGTPEPVIAEVLDGVRSLGR